MSAQERERDAVDALRAEHVHVVEFRVLFRGERLGRAEHHVAGVVDQRVQATALAQDRRNGCLDRGLGLHVQLDGAQIHAGLRRARLERPRLRDIALGDVAHAGVDSVSGLPSASAASAPNPLEAPVMTMIWGMP